MNTRTLTQAQSVLSAENVGKGWTVSELSLVAETTELPVIEVAECLSRTVYGVEKVRELMARGITIMGSDRPANRKAVVTTVCSRCYLEVPVAGTCC